jgi:hypothetical protein
MSGEVQRRVSDTSDVDLTDDEIRGLHRIAKEVGDPQIMTLCEIALGDIGITRTIARHALRGAKS